MVMQGLGVSVIARLAAQPVPPGIQVRSLPVPLERIIQVAVLADALLPPSVYAFLDALKSFDYPHPAPLTAISPPQALSR
jgi:DNA-binding transcriptional LysR family regulator